jgi:predicted NBD/HSP70 family sugar kinase
MTEERPLGPIKGRPFDIRSGMAPAGAAMAAGPAPRAFDHARGSNQNGVRLYNERLVLSLIRRHRNLSKVEIARLTGLSVQTASGIVGRLEQDGLLLRLDPQRGRVGQPAIPFTLHPEGALSLGLKIGRRSCDLVLIDFLGHVRHRLHETYPYPLPAPLTAFVADNLERLTRTLPPGQQQRIAGLGIALPFELWNWESEVGAPAGAMQSWRSVDIQAEIALICPWPVSLCNDATAACGAELFFGEGARFRDFVYFFIGSFIGGGIVLDGNLYAGRTGNAGAVGSMPIAAEGPIAGEGPTATGGATQQLIRSASIYVLEKKLIAAGKDPARIWQSPDAWGDFGPQLDEWIEETAASLAQAVVAAISVIDFEAAIIDGAFPAEVRQRILARTAEKMAGLDCQGLSAVQFSAGTIGSDARAIGGAALPLLASFARDREVLFKEPAQMAAK